MDLFSDVRDVLNDNQIRFEQLLKDVQALADKIVKEMEYPKGCIGIYENKTKTEINYPLEIREVRRSVPNKSEANKETDIAEGKDEIRLNYLCSTIVTLVLAKERSKNAGCVILRLGVPAFNAVPVPLASIIKERWIKNGDKEADINSSVSLGDGVESPGSGKTLARYDVFVRLDDIELLPYFERLMRNRLKCYKSNEPSYGCCHLYEQCSDAMRCISKDKMYATVCAYKKNLEAGRIFYGRNKNI